MPRSYGQNPTTGQGLYAGQPLHPCPRRRHQGDRPDRSLDTRITLGTVTSHFTECLAQAAIETDLRVSWFTLESLSAATGTSKADGFTVRTVARICRADFIVIDDIGLLPVGEDAAEAFYRIIDAAYERRSIAVTSNIHPSMLRHDHAEDSRGRKHRPPHAPRSPRDHHPRLASPRRRPRREGSSSPEPTPIPRNTTGRPWISDGHQLGHPRAAHLNIPTAVDNPGRGCRDQGSVHGQWWIDDSRAGIVTGFGRALADAVLRTASGLAARAARRTD